MKPFTDAMRFWSKVDIRGPQECWPWRSATVRRGYGVIWHDGNNKRAHRIAYLLAHGTLPDDKVVMHACDNPACVNPAHLSLGSTQENTADRDRKGRSTRGEGQHLSKLTAADALRIFRDERPGPEIALEFGVNKSTINNIRRGATWRHVTFAPDYLRDAVESIGGKRA